ncbi:MAG: arginase [Flavobacteriales bacterium TMED113]|nr:MAG: arginase [Flavobacteriales bacterium TMED113]
MNSIKILINMSELGAGTRGSSLSYSSIVTASHNLNSDFFLKNKVEEIPNENSILFSPGLPENAKYIDEIIVIYKRISDKIKSTCLDNKIPLIISGDHSNAGGTITGLREAFPDKKIGIFWIDAHADLHSPYTTPSGNIHGMPLATALKEDNIISKVNEVDANTAKKWNKLKGMKAKIMPEHIIFLGVRDTEIQEDEMISRLNIKKYSVNDLRKKSLESCINESLESLSDCEIIYVSLDVDSLDPSISNGTGTSVDNGFTVDEVKKILNLIADSKKIGCLEITEVNPTLDTKGNAMAEAAFEILQDITNKLISK